MLRPPSGKITPTRKSAPPRTATTLGTEERDGAMRSGMSEGVADSCAALDRVLGNLR